MQDNLVPGFTLRSFGVHRVGTIDGSTVESICDQLSEAVLLTWMGDSTPNDNGNLVDGTKLRLGIQSVDDDALDPLLNQYVTDHNLHFDPIWEQIRVEVNEQLTDHSIQNLIASLPSKVSSRECHEKLSEAFNLLNDVFGPNEKQDSDVGSMQASGSIGAPLAKSTKRKCMEIGTQTFEWCQALVDEPSLRIRGGLRAAQWLTEHFKTIDDEANRRHGDIQRQLLPLSAQFRSLGNDGGTTQFKGGKSQQDGMSDLKTAVSHYYQLRIEDLTLALTRFAARIFVAQLKSVVEKFRNLKSDLSTLATSFCPRSPLQTVGDDDDLMDDQPVVDDPIRTGILEQLSDKAPKLVTELERYVVKKVFGQEGGLRSALQQEMDLRKRVIPLLQVAARTSLIRALGSIDVARIVLSDDNVGDNRRSVLQGYVESALPDTGEAGGGQRLLMLVGKNSDHNQLSQVIDQQLEHPSTVVITADGDLAFCVEAQGLSIPHLALKVVDQRRDYAEAASRLYTRTDVKWNPWARTK